MAHTTRLEATVAVEGLSVRLRLSAGNLHVDGPFMGNIEVTVVSEPTLPPKVLLESLAIRSVADPDRITAMAYESFPDGRLEITFHSPTAAGTQPRPQSLTVWWGAAPPLALGTLPLHAVQE